MLSKFRLYRRARSNLLKEMEHISCSEPETDVSEFQNSDRYPVFQLSSSCYSLGRFVSATRRVHHLFASAVISHFQVDLMVPALPNSLLSTASSSLPFGIVGARHRA